MLNPKWTGPEPAKSSSNTAAKLVSRHDPEFLGSLTDFIFIENRNDDQYKAFGHQEIKDWLRHRNRRDRVGSNLEAQIFYQFVRRLASFTAPPRQPRKPRRCD